MPEKKDFRLPNKQASGSRTGKPKITIVKIL